jgi:hypothetical protein
MRFWSNGGPKSNAAVLGERAERVFRAAAFLLAE